MRKICAFTFVMLIAAFSPALCAETVFFGSIDSLFTTNDNLRDAHSDTDDSYEYMDTKLILGIENRQGDNLKGVVSFEVGNIIWGVNGENYPAGRNTGGGAAGDGVNVETKNIYIDFNLPEKEINLKCGLMPFNIANGIIAGDDAFGATITVSDELNATINLIRIYQDSLGTRYDYNVEDPDRKESFVDLEIYQDLTEDMSMKLLFGALIDKYYNDPDFGEIDRDIFYVGASFAESDKDSGISIDFIGNTGDIRNSNDEGGIPLEDGSRSKRDVSGYLVNISGKTKFGMTEISLNFLYATGDDSSTSGKYEGFIVPETSYVRDIAEIMTRGELSDEIEGDEDFAAYRYIPEFSNVYYIKGALNHQMSKKTDFSAAVIYAALPEEVYVYEAGNIKAHKIGTEIDLKLRHKIYTADDQQKGLTFNLIAALLLGGDVFDDYTDTEGGTYTVDKGNNIYEFGAKLTYEF